jgi:hypothetical protein
MPTDEKITQLTAVTTIADADLFVTVQDVATTPVTRGETVTKIKQSIGTGWIPATGTWSYLSADAPTFVISVNADVTSQVGVGMRLRGVQSATTKYFIITAVGAYGGGVTLVTVYGGTDYTLANAQLVSPCYSPYKFPFGFPASQTKWTVSVSDTNKATKTTPAAATWYGDTGLTSTGPSISLPIGSWHVSYKCLVDTMDTTVTDYNIYSSLSTSASAESDTRFTSLVVQTVPSGSFKIWGTPYIEDDIDVTVKTVYYLVIKTTTSTADNIDIRGDVTPSLIKAVCAYL